MKNSKNYREILKFEFDIRKKRNPSYSLRSFAKLLDMPSSGLSQILGGKQGLSVTNSKRIGKILGWNQQEIEFFCDLVISANGRSSNERQLAKLRLKKYEWQEGFLKDDMFKFMSNWYHFGILELTTLKNFDSSPQWIATSLGITLKEAKEGIKTLKHLQLLKEDDNGQLTRVHDFVGTTTDIPTDALKLYHSDILKKGLEALFEQTVDERDYSAIIFAINKKDLPLAKERIKDFRRSLMLELEANPDRDEVYALGVQFYKLTERQ